MVLNDSAKTKTVVHQVVTIYLHSVNLCLADTIPNKFTVISKYR